MIFFGAFFSADELSLSASPTSIENINSLTIYNTILDTLYATQNPDVTPSVDIPTEWDFDTVMQTTFDDGTTSATNVTWTLDTVSHLAIKRKKMDEFEWTTLLVKEIHTLEDFNLHDVDITPTTGEYLYAVVPMLNGIEGAYTTVPVNIEVTQLTISDSTGVWSTFITDGSCDTVNETPGAFVATLNSKYPTYVSNTIANYQTITVSGEFYPTNDQCSLDLMDDDVIRVKYIKEFIDFLTNRKPKILKAVDGRRWLVMVDNGVTDSMVDFYKTRNISFSCVEIGNPDSTEDLTLNGFIDVSESYW